MEPCVSCIYLTNCMEYVWKSPLWIGIFQRVTQRARMLLTDNIQSGGSCSVNYYYFILTRAPLWPSFKYNYLGLGYHLSHAIKLTATYLPSLTSTSFPGRGLHTDTFCSLPSACWFSNCICFWQQISTPSWTSFSSELGGCLEQFWVRHWATKKAEKGKIPAVVRRL